MLSPEVLLLAIVLVALVVFRFWLDPSRRGDRNRRELLSRIADVDDGDIVAVHGYVRRSEALLRSPLTAKVCIGYSVMVEAGGRTVVEESNLVDFLLEDATGTALVREEGAILVLVDPQTGTVGDSFADIETLLARHEETGAMNRTMRYREAIVRLDQPVIVTGLGRWIATPDAPGRRLILESTPESPLRVTDDLSQLDAD